MQTLKEGTTTFVTNSNKKISKEMPVFYNPVMKLNRDLSLVVLCTMKNPKIGLPMEASGVRAARIVNELINTKKINPYELLINDISPSAITLCKKNVKYKKAEFFNEDANVFLRKNRPFDYIDIDPFGTPNPFVDAAVQAIRNKGIIAVTATDTSALAGTYPRATQRKYWAQPSRTWAMHDLGLRILIRKIQLVAAQYDKALTPILSVSTDHYYRIFFRCDQGVNKVKEVIKQHKHISIDTKNVTITVDEGSVGPLWIGTLHEKKFVKEVLRWSRALNYDNAEKLLELINDECNINTVGFVDMHEIASKHNLELPKRDAFLAKLGKHGCRTHVSPTGFKTDLPREKITKLF